jgi:mycofactocin system glycosyltransferase
VRLDRDTRVRDDGRTLLGGAPFRALFLTAAAAGMIRDGALTVVDAATASLAQRLVDAGMAHPDTRTLPAVDRSLVTYVIPAYGRSTELARLLESIGPGHDVIVVDDGYPEPEVTAKVAAEHGARLLVLDRNVGPASARNAGLREVRTPYVAFVDTDVVVNPADIALLARHFVDPRVAAVAPHVRGLQDASPTTWVRRYENANSSLDLGAHPATVRPKSPVSWVSSSCLLVRVEALGEGFSPGLQVGEDVDLVWRLVEEGWSVRYDPTGVAHHEHRTRLLQWAGRKAFYGTGAADLARRHPGDVAPAVLAPWSAALLLVLLAQRRWSLPAAGALTGVAAVRIGNRLGRTARPYRLGAVLACGGAVNAVFQGSALLLRHWWPAVAVGCLASRRLRRAVVLAGLAEAALAYRDHARIPDHLDPVRYTLLRRLDDLAYGAGVWWSVLRTRTWRALAPEVRARRRTTGPGRTGG